MEMHSIVQETGIVTVCYKCSELIPSLRLSSSMLSNTRLYLSAAMLPFVTKAYEIVKKKDDPTTVTTTLMNFEDTRRRYTLDIGESTLAALMFFFTIFGCLLATLVYVCHRHYFGEKKIQSEAT